MRKKFRNRQNLLSVAICCLLLTSCTTTATNQTSTSQNPLDKIKTEISAPVDISAFDGYEEWPMIIPGDITVKNAKLKDQRIIFDARFPGAQGLNGPLEKTTMMYDTSKVFFKGKPALWLQWTSTGRLGGKPGTASLDYLIVDRDTHRTMHRIQSMGSAMGPPTWTGPFAIINYPENTIYRTIIKEDGSADTAALELDDTGTIDFAALPFWLPFIDLEVGKKFRVPYYRGQLNETGGLPVYVQGLKEIYDAHGKLHTVWNVQVMGIGGGSFTEFWISEEAPYFMGWEFRIVASGKPVSIMAYDKHWILER